MCSALPRGLHSSIGPIPLLSGELITFEIRDTGTRTLNGTAEIFVFLFFEKEAPSLSARMQKRLAKRIKVIDKGQTEKCYSELLTPGCEEHLTST